MAESSFDKPKLDNVRQSNVPEEQVKMLQELVKTHDIGLKYDPKYLGAGSEQVVYSIPSHLGIVAKAAYLTFQKSIDWNIAHGLPPNSLTPELQKHMHSDISGERQRFERMRSYFGFDHVLPHRKYVVNLPTSEELLQAVYGRAGATPPEGVREAPAILTIQKRSEGLQDPQSLTFTYGDTSTILDAAMKDDSLKECLSDFCTRCIRYTNQTGEIIDVGMPDNVVFYHKNNSWTFELIDGLYPQTSNVIEVMNEARKNPNILSSNQQERLTDMTNGLGYVRAINGLAEKLGLSDRVSYTDDLDVRSDGDKP